MAFWVGVPTSEGSSGSPKQKKMAKETAEQKLLKLIENLEGAPPATPEPQMAPKTAQAVKGPEWSQAFKMPSVFHRLGNPLKGWRGEPAIGLREINVFLSVGIAVLSGLLIWNFAQGLKEIRSPLGFDVGGSVGVVMTNLSITSKPLSHYLNPIQVRSIFRPYEKKEPEPTQEPPPPPVVVPRIEELTKNLRLVGISWRNGPASAAMIEDQKAQVTHILKTGDQLEGVTIREIQRDQVILTDGEGTVTLKL